MDKKSIILLTARFMAQLQLLVVILVFMSLVLPDCPVEMVLVQMVPGLLLNQLVIKVRHKQ